MMSISELLTRPSLFEIARASELVAIDVAQLTRAPDGAGELFIPFAKNDPEGEGSYRYVSAASINRIAEWLDLADINEGPMFRGMARSGSLLEKAVAADTVGRIYKKMVERYFRRRKNNPLAPLTKEEMEIIDAVSCHSPRVGVCQDAVAAGDDLLERFSN